MAEVLLDSSSGLVVGKKLDLEVYSAFQLFVAVVQNYWMPVAVAAFSTVVAAACAAFVVVSTVHAVTFVVVTVVVALVYVGFVAAAVVAAVAVVALLSAVASVEN